MNLVFASDSIWNWEAEKNFARLKEENPDLIQAAQRGHSVVDPETGQVRRRSSAAPTGQKFSLVAGANTRQNVQDEKGAGNESSDNNGDRQEMEHLKKWGNQGVHERGLGEDKGGGHAKSVRFLRTNTR